MFAYIIKNRYFKEGGGQFLSTGTITTAPFYYLSPRRGLYDFCDRSLIFVSFFSTVIAGVYKYIVERESIADSFMVIIVQL